MAICRSCIKEPFFEECRGSALGVLRGGTTRAEPRHTPFSAVKLLYRSSKSFVAVRITTRMGNRRVIISCLLTRKWCGENLWWLA